MRRSALLRLLLGGAGRALLVLLLALAALVLAALAGANLPWVRSWLAREVSQQVSREIAGTLTITQLEHVGLISVAGVEAQLTDAAGRRVLAASGLKVELDALRAACSWFGDGPLELGNVRIVADALDVDLHLGAGGELALIQALQPRAGRASAGARTDATPIEIEIERLTVREIRMHGGAGVLAGSAKGAVEASLHDVSARGRLDAGTLELELRHARAEARNVPIIGALSGELTGMIRLPLEEGPTHELAAEARWRGSLAELAVDAGVVFAGGRLSGFLRSDASPTALMQLWPEGPWSREPGQARPVHVLLAFEGLLDALAARVVIESTGGDLYVDGHVDLAELAGRATVIAERLDLGRWLAPAPRTSLRFVAALAFERTAGAFTGRLALRSSGASLAGRPLPDLALSALLGRRSIDAQLRAGLSGADAVMTVGMPLRSSRVHEGVAFEVHARVSDMARALSSLGIRANVSGRGTLRGRGRLELGEPPRLSDGQLRAELHGAATGGVQARWASLDAAIGGRLDRLGLELRFDARQLSLPHYPLERVSVHAEGGLERLQVRAELDPRRAPPLQLTARLSPAARTLSELALAAGSGADAVRASAQTARITDRGYALDGLVVRSGAGLLRLAGALSGDALHVRARASAFSAADVARRLGVGLTLPDGIADLSLELERRAGRLSGTLSGSVTELGLGPVRHGTLHADLVAKRGVLRGRAGLDAMPFGQLRLRLDDLELPARWRPRALADLAGGVELLALADLGQLARIEGLTALISNASLGGTVEAQLTLRGDGRGEPNAQLALTTRELAWSLPRDAALGDAALARTATLSRASSGLDIALNLDVRDSRLAAHARLIDAGRAVIAGLRASAPLPVAHLLRAPGSVDRRALAFDAHFYVPERELRDFPAPLRLSGVDGTLRAEASVRGPLGRPELTAHVQLGELRIENGRGALPLTIVADAHLAGDQLSASAGVRDEQRKLVSLAAGATLGTDGGAPWQELDVDLRSNGLPLEALGVLLGQEVAGELYGALSLRMQDGAPAARGTLWVNAPSYRGFRQKQARWALEAGTQAFSTELLLTQHGGSAHVMLSGPWRWEGAALPSVDWRLLRGTLSAERFDLRALAPILPAQGRGVGGRLDAELALDASRPGAGRGEARLRDGRVYVAALGQEFRDISLDAELEQSGDVTIERLSARALDGRVAASGQVALAGLAFRHAELDVNIPRSAPLPVALEGVTVATAWGRLDVSARAEPGAAGEPLLLDVRVQVPRLELVLPELNPPDVQELSDDPTIEVGTFLEPDRFTSLPLPPYAGDVQPEPEDAALAVRVNVELGDEVWLQREPEVELKVVGQVEVELRDELTLDGQLRLARGDIEVQGRTFQIERGEITFHEDREPGNPTVVATGVYTADEGTRVYAEFVGPAQTGKLTLRAEPPLRDDQILSLLLFGSTDGSFGTSTGESAGDPLDTVSGTALVAGGNVVAQGLNVELRRLTSLDIQTRIGSREGEPQPEVAVQLTPRLTAELAYRLEAPTPGRAPDRTYLTLDLRLFRNWSVSTTIGDAGSFVLDLLWRHRY